MPGLAGHWLDVEKLPGPGPLPGGNVVLLCGLAFGLLTGCARVNRATTVGGPDGGSADVASGFDAPTTFDGGPGIDIVVVPPTDSACPPVSCTPAGGQYCGVIGDGCHGSKDCGACAGAGQVCTDHLCVEVPSCVRGTCAGAGGASYCGKIGSGCGEEYGGPLIADTRRMELYDAAVRAVRRLHADRLTVPTEQLLTATV